PPRGWSDAFAPRRVRAVPARNSRACPACAPRLYLAETRMRLSLRFVLPLFLALGAFAYAAVPLVDKLTLQWFMRDLDIRASLIANTVQEPLQDLIQTGNRTRMLQFFNRITQDERLFAMGFCPSAPGQPVITPTLPTQIRCTELAPFSAAPGHLLRSANGPLLVSVRPLEAAGVPVGNLVVVHDLSFIARRSAETRKYLFLFFVGLSATVALITVAIAQLSWRGWVQGLRALLRGEGLVRPAASRSVRQLPELRPIASDQHARVAVPPEQPAYQLRRVWLTPEQEAGYYYGFANEGLWPLCHIAHVRPIFRTSDWEQYVTVNRAFARAVVEEAKSSDPIVLVQDYHFALLPRMIQEELPDATIVSFWHIPWPNPEAFAICPWRDELLDGLLGSSILGFHTQFHCNNFVDTVDRLMEATVDLEMFRVPYRCKLTA